MDIGEYILANERHLRAWGGSVVSQICSIANHLLKVPAGFRVKDPESARIKQFKKAYSNPSIDMTDLVGARFVVLTSTDLKPIQNFVENNSDWQVVIARDPREEINIEPATFGYQSHHYEVRPRRPIVVDDVELTTDFCCEVQVRTLLQHAYAELTHDTFYKPTQAVPSQALRYAARSMALMETTDELLCKAMEAVRNANAPAEALRAAAGDMCVDLGRAKSAAAFNTLADQYRDRIKQDSVVLLGEFLVKNNFVLERIRGRLGRGLFAYPDAALVTYWLAAQLENRLVASWPLPGLISDAQQVLSDMGIGGSDA
jgi:ppGpp synthetase/RelA/SpoT-type nucleotidyltranferase